MVAMTAYVHKELPAFTQGAAKIITARLVLVLVGIAFGITGALYVEGRLPQLASFLIGFGLVHLPAAIVLFVKRKRGEGRS